MLKVGYDAQTFLCSNGGLGKGRQLRNLLGRHIDHFAGFATPAPNYSGVKLIQEGASRHRIWQLKPRLMDVYIRRQVPASVSRAEVILTVSEYSRADILRIFPEANVRVIPCTIPESWFDSAPIEAREDFLLMVTSSAPHKNAEGAITGYAQYARLAGKSAAPMKIVGLSREAASYKPLLEELDIADLVCFMPFLDEGELRNLYRKARAVIVPSLAEGFGIPVLEAMASGTPVLCSKAASLPEVGGTAPFYFDPHKASDIGSAVESVMNDVSLRQTMAGLGLQRAQDFHPSVVSKVVDEFWSEVAHV
jgi:glycosyltransferase involved in cell wall biosynthesis